MMILPLIGTILSSLMPVLVLLARDYVEKRKARDAESAPIVHQGEVDAEIHGDKRALAVRLSRLHDAVRAQRDPSAQ